MRISSKLGVVADDLTGANDTAVQFAKQGLTTMVLMDAMSVADVALRTDVIVIDTETRPCSFGTAYRRVRGAVRTFRKAGIKRVYKKVDSTLRGNIGVELEAIMDELEVKTCIFTPAFPANGRIVVGGYLLVNQVPLEKTEIAEGRLMRIRTSHIPTILKSQTKRKVGHIPLSKVMQGRDLLKNEINNLRKRGVRMIVIDAVSSQDLSAIAQAAVASNTAQFMSGSAGLAEALPEALKLNPSLPAFVIAGSPSTITIQQLAKASEELNAAIFDLNSSKVLTDVDGQEEIRRIVNEAGRILQTERDVVIASSRSRDSMAMTIQRGRELGMNEVEVMRRVASALGESANRILEHVKIGGLILTGGQTAIETLRMMKAVGVKVIDEVSPGIPFGEVVGGKHDGLRVITKAGAFGRLEAISESIRYLRKHIRRPEIQPHNFNTILNGH